MHDQKWGLGSLGHLETMCKAGERSTMEESTRRSESELGFR